MKLFYRGVSLRGNFIFQQSPCGKKTTTIIITIKKLTMRKKRKSHGVNQTLQRGHFTEEGGERCLLATTLVQRKMQLKQNLSAT